MELKICHLYPDVLNLYGDTGNILCMRQRLAWRGIDSSVLRVRVGEKLDLSDCDLLLIGGGQDFEQEVLLPDLRSGKAECLCAAIEDGICVLAICGGYQILGREWLLGDEVVEGLGIVDITTGRAEGGSHNRLVGNIMF